MGPKLLPFTKNKKIYVNLITSSKCVIPNLQYITLMKNLKKAKHFECIEWNHKNGEEPHHILSFKIDCEIVVTLWIQISINQILIWNQPQRLFSRIIGAFHLKHWYQVTIQMSWIAIIIYILIKCNLDRRQDQLRVLFKGQSQLFLKFTVILIWLIFLMMKN